MNTVFKDPIPIKAITQYWVEFPLLIQVLITYLFYMK